MENKDKENLLLEASEFYKSLADFSRLKIIYELLQGEKCVNEIVSELKMTQTAVSYQLKQLRAARLVKYRRSGQHVFYSIDDEHVSMILNLTFEHLREER